MYRPDLNDAHNPKRDPDCARRSRDLLHKKKRLPFSRPGYLLDPKNGMKVMYIDEHGRVQQVDPQPRWGQDYDVEDIKNRYGAPVSKWHKDLASYMPTPGNPTDGVEWTHKTPEEPEVEPEVEMEKETNPEENVQKPEDNEEAVETGTTNQKVKK